MERYILVFALLFFGFNHAHAGVPVLPVKEVERTIPAQQEEDQGEEGQSTINSGTLIDTTPAGAAAMREARSADRAKAKKWLEQKRDNLNEFERLALPLDFSSPDREEILPYRFNDTSKLRTMLRDPKWASYWESIALAVGMAADEKAALDLMAYVKTPAPATVHKRYEDRGRLRAIVALGYTLVDQDVPEVLQFLEQLTDSSYAQSLKFSEKRSARTARINAYHALSVAATDEAIGILETRKDEFDKSKQNGLVQSLATGEHPPSNVEKAMNGEFTLIDHYLDYARKKRAGLSGQSENSEDGDPVP